MTDHLTNIVRKHFYFSGNEFAYHQHRSLWPVFHFTIPMNILSHLGRVYSKCMTVYYFLR